MTKIEAIKEHIALREQFWKPYSKLGYAYGFFRCMFHSQAVIESASRGLRQWIRDYGTAAKLNATL